MKLSLAAQLRLGFAAAFLLALSVAATAWWIALSYEEEIVSAYETQLRTTVQLAEAQSAFWQLRFEVRQFMVEGPERQRRILEMQNSHYAIIEERLAAYDKAASSADERRALTSLLASFQRYKQARPRFFELWQAGEKDDAIAWLALTIVPFGEETEQAFATQIMLQQSFVERGRAGSERRVRLALNLATAITIVLLGMLVSGYAYAMRMLRPIRALRAQTEGMVREQLGDIPDAVASSNEVTALAESFQLMSRRLVAHTASLHQSLDRLDFLLRATPAVIWTGPAREPFGRTFVSANVRALLGHEPEDFLRDPEFWSRNIHPDDRAQFMAGLAAIEREDSHTHEYRFRHKDGSWLWMRAELRVIRDAAGVPCEMIGYWIDITEHRRAEAALVEAVRVKSAFMNNVTHELRTPLNSVIGFAELLKEEVPGPLNAKQAAFAADILASGRHLLALVEAILEMSRVDAPGTTIEREPVEIDAVLEDRVAAHRKAAVARQISLALDVPEDMGREMLDPEALRRMLDALLDNAIKFNIDGGRVAVSGRRAGGWLEIAVADTGIGIREEDQAKVFQPLVQLDAGLARRRGGVGVGLALARGLAERLGGTLEVESRPGGGATFTLRLPTEEPS